MTVGELKELLNQYSDKTNVCVVTDRMGYAYDFYCEAMRTFTPFWGEETDEKILTLYFTDQIGKV